MNENYGRESPKERFEYSYLLNMFMMGVLVSRVTSALGPEMQEHERRVQTNSLKRLPPVEYATSFFVQVTITTNEPKYHAIIFIIAQVIQEYICQVSLTF